MTTNVGHKSDILNTAGGRLNAVAIATVVANDYTSTTGESIRMTADSFVKTLGYGSK